MNSSLYFILLCPLLFFLASSGQLYTWDLMQDFNNYNYANEIAIKFMLETPLPSISFLRLRMPFAIEGSGLAAYYNKSDLCSGYNDYQLTTITKSTLTLDSGTNTYLIQFYEDHYLATTNPMTPVSLPANTWYKLRIVMANPVPLGTKTIQPLELSTISTNNDNFIIYDSNHNIGNLFYLEPPQSTLLITNNQSNFYDMMTRNDILITARPSKQIPILGRFNIILSNEKYSFSSLQTCVVSYYKIDPTEAILFTNATCALESNTSMFVNIPATIEPSWYYNINFNLKIPSYHEPCSISVYSMYSSTKTIVEISSSTVMISTKPPRWNPLSTIVKIGWGIELKTSTSPLFGLYRNSPNQDFYNTIHFFFSPLISTPLTVNGKLIVTFGSSATILQNSFIYALNAYKKTKISCTLTSNTITCLNVAGLLSNTVYSIALKISLAYDNANSNTLPSDFGDIYYYPMYRGIYSTLSLVPSKIFALTIPIVNNLDRIDRQSPNFDNQAVHTKETIGQTVGTSGFGVQYKGISTYQVLEFNLGILPTDFTSGILGSSAGIDIYTSSVIMDNEASIYSESDCYSNTGGFNPTTHIGVCTIQTQTLSHSTSIKTTNLKLGFKDAAFAARAWDMGTNYIGFGFNNILVSRHTSLYVDESLLDFYIGFVEKGFTSTGIPLIFYKQMMINSFTISVPRTFSGLKLTLSNFWTSPAGTESLSGEYLTAFIRFSGSLTLEENTKLHQFFVFFDYLSGYSDENPSGTVPRCGLPVNGDCVYVKGINTAGIMYPLLNRYEINLNSDIRFISSLQIVVPVASLAAQQSFYVFLATGSKGVIFNIMRYKLTANSIDIPSWKLVNSLGYPTITGANYGILNRGVIPVGGTSKVSINFYHTDSSRAFFPNDESYTGAAFTYITSYNFVNASATIAFNFSLSGSNLGEGCLYMKYLYSFKYRYVIYCPIYSEVTPHSISSLTINNFKMPFTKGISLPIDSIDSKSTYASISNFHGLLLHYEKDTTEEIMIPNILTLPVNPTVGSFYIGQKDIDIGFRFTNKNEIPSISRIAILSFDGSSFNFLINEAMNCEIINNLGVSIASYSCSQVNDFNKIEAIITLTDNTLQLPSSSYTLYFKGIDVNDNALIGSQSFYIKTMDYHGNVIDQSINTNLFYVKIRQDLKISKVDFEHLNKKASGFCNITFVLNRAIRIDQYLKFKLEALSENNQEAYQNYGCQVVFAENDTIAENFKTCQFNNYFNEIILTIQIDINESNVLFKLVLRNIRNPYSVNPYNFSIAIYSIKNHPLMISQDYQLPVFYQSDPLIYPEIVLIKLFNTLGAKTTVIFQVTSRIVAIEENTRILIKFPYYYTPFLSDKSKIIVFLNQEMVEHLKIREYSVEIYAFKTQIPAHQTFNISITGVDLPYFASELSYFFLGLISNNNSENIYQNLTEFGEVIDITSYSSNTVGFLNVYSLTFSNNFILEYSDYEFIIIFSLNIQANDYILLIDFSLDWTAFPYYFPVNCYSKENSEALFTTLPCSYKGLQLIVNLTNNYSSGIYSYFKVNLRNPETLSCNLRKFMVSLAPKTSENITYRSPESLLNIAPLQFFEQTALLRWKFEILIDGIYQQITNITILAGSYSKEIRWSLLSGNRIDQNVWLTYLNVYNDEFKLYPSQPMFQVGTKYTFFRIGTPIGTAFGNYDLYFNVLQNSYFLKYGRADTVHITVLNEPLTIPKPNIMNVSIAILGFSLPVIIDMGDSPPYNEIAISTQLDYFPDLGLDFVSSDQFSISYENIRGVVVFKSLYLLDPNYKTTTASLVLDQTTSGNYTLKGNYITPILIENNDANITDTNINFNINSSTKIFAGVKFSNIGYLYYHVKRSDSSLVRSFSEVYNMSKNGFNYDFFDPNEENVGVVYYYNSNVLQNFTIDKLRANRNYTLSLWSYDLNGQSYLINKENITTLSQRDSYYIRVKIETDSIMTREELKMLSCYFCISFQLTVNQ